MAGLHTAINRFGNVLRFFSLVEIWLVVEVRFFMFILRALLEVSSSLSHPLVIGCQAKENLAGGILGRFIEDDLGKRLKAFGIEKVKGISLCQVEGGKPSSPQLLTTEESENQF